MKKFVDNFEEYVCAVGLTVMTIFTFLGVLSRKLPQVNLSWTMELVTTMFVWVCALAAATVFKTNSHMGFSYIADRTTGWVKTMHKWLRIAILFGYFAIWLIYGGRLAFIEYEHHLVTPVMGTPGWLIGLAIPLAGVLAIIRILQYEFSYGFRPLGKEDLP